jgi:hypothetical protein
MTTSKVPNPSQRAPRVPVGAEGAGKMIFVADITP